MRQWRFVENGSTHTWGSTGWHDMDGILATLSHGANNWSTFFSKSGATITTKVGGVWKFTLVTTAATQSRFGCGVFDTSNNELQSAFMQNRSNSYSTCTCIALLSGAAGSTWKFREYNDNTDATKLSDTTHEYIIIEHWG